MASRAEKGQDYGPTDGCFNLIGLFALGVVSLVSILRKMKGR